MCTWISACHRPRSGASGAHWFRTISPIARHPTPHAWPPMSPVSLVWYDTQVPTEADLKSPLVKELIASSASIHPLVWTTTPWILTANMVSTRDTLRLVKRLKFHRELLLRRAALFEIRWVGLQLLIVRYFLCRGICDASPSRSTPT